MTAQTPRAFRHYADLATPITRLRVIDGRTLIETTDSAYWLEATDCAVTGACRIWTAEAPTFQPAISYAAPPPIIGTI